MSARIAARPGMASRMLRVRSAWAFIQACTSGSLRSSRRRSGSSTVIPKWFSVAGFGAGAGGGTGSAAANASEAARAVLKNVRLMNM